MYVRTNIPFSAFFISALGVSLACPLGAQLADQSPFLPPAAANSAAATADNASIELRGIMSTSAGMRFCIYDATKKTSQWVGLNESGPIVVKSADPDHDAVTVVGPDSRLVKLTLRAPKTGGSGGAPQFVSTVPSNGYPPMPSIRAVLNPTPEDEQRRLQAIADEVRRRRLLREQGQQPGAPGPATVQPGGQSGNGPPP